MQNIKLDYAIGSHLYSESLLPASLLSVWEHVPENSPHALIWRPETYLTPRPSAQLLLCLLGCHDSTPSNAAGMLLITGSLGKGTGGLSGTLLRGDHNEGSPPGESVWLPPGDLNGVTPSLCSSPDGWADSQCSHHPGPLGCFASTRRRTVRAVFSARWLCHMLHSARSTSMLSLRWLTAVADIEKCSSLKGLGKSTLFLFPFNSSCNRIFEPLVMPDRQMTRH